MDGMAEKTFKNDKKKPKIILVDYGLANHFGDRIEINKDLKKYPKLYNHVLKHELSHTDKDFSMQDLKNDLKINISISLKLLAFVIRRPKIWYEFLPIYKRKNKLIYDMNLILLYILGIILILILIIII